MFSQVCCVSNPLLLSAQETETENGTLAIEVQITKEKLGTAEVAKSNAEEKLLEVSFQTPTQTLLHPQSNCHFELCGLLLPTSPCDCPSKLKKCQFQ